MSRTPARRPVRSAGATVDFKTVFLVLVGLTVLSGACAMWLGTRGPESQTEGLKTALQGFLGMAEAGFGGVLGLMVGRGHPK